MRWLGHGPQGANSNNTDLLCPAACHPATTQTAMGGLMRRLPQSWTAVHPYACMRRRADGQHAVGH